MASVNLPSVVAAVIQRCDPGLAQSSNYNRIVAGRSVVASDQCDLILPARLLQDNDFLVRGGHGLKLLTCLHQIDLVLEIVGPATFVGAGAGPPLEADKLVILQN